jgi:hypothetical protein
MQGRLMIVQPRRWDLDVHPETGDRPQEIIDRQIVDTLQSVRVFWHRIGTPSGVAQSGTIEEIERSVDRKKPVFLYFSQGSGATESRLGITGCGAGMQGADEAARLRL